MKRLHTSVDTLNKHECLLFVTHNAKLWLIAVFDSFIESAIVFAKTSSQVRFALLFFRKTSPPVHAGKSSSV